MEVAAELRDQERDRDVRPWPIHRLAFAAPWPCSISSCMVVTLVFMPSNRPHGMRELGLEADDTISRVADLSHGLPFQRAASDGRLRCDGCEWSSWLGFFANPTNFSFRLKSVFRGLFSTAFMHTRNSKPVLRCTNCNSQKIEIYDPLTDCAAVYCAECGTETGTVRELVSEIEARIIAQEQEQRRWLH